MPEIKPQSASRSARVIGPGNAGALPTTVEARRSRIASEIEPPDAILMLREDEQPFALSGEWLGTGERRTLLGSSPLAVAAAASDPFELIARAPSVETGDAMVGGGWIGWIGYSAGRRVERLPPDPPAPVPSPEHSLAFYDHLLLHDEGGWWFECLWSEDRDAHLTAIRERWEERLAGTPPRALTGRRPEFRIDGDGAAGHLAAVEACRERIAAGELFQANLCLRLSAESGGGSVDLFGEALRRTEPRFGAMVDSIVSLSPERFLRRTGREVLTEPIKGTAARPTDPDESAAAAERLAESGKDAAEHVMIVDLMRNDLGRVCEYGSIAAEQARLEPHPGVWHLVSSVSGRLRPEVDDGELLRATFPPGSVTGAPKVQAMKVIGELESTARETYTGVIGIASPVAGLDLNVAIRTFELRGGKVWLGAGGGIVAGSEPGSELAEALDKAAGPIAAIGGALAPSARAAFPRLSTPPTRQIAAALDFGERPRPELGVFETILVRDSRAISARDHLLRLARSIETLYGETLPADLPARVTAAAAQAGEARLRVIAEPGREIEVETVALGTSPAGPARLVPFVLPGGLGAHKWRDRELLNALTEQCDGGIPLIVGSDGQVLEAAYANVWIAEGSRLLTPPADGRILAGVTRAGILASTAGAAAEPIPFDRLRSAERIFLSSSISGRRLAVIDREAAVV